jgi:hypothetical protein
MRRKKPRPEFIKFWAEIASLRGKPVTESMTPSESRTPEELSTRAKTAAKMRLRNQGRDKPRAAKKIVGR